MTLHSLRTKHPRLVYQAFDVEKNAHELIFRYHFLLEPDIIFTPETRVPIQSPVDTEALRPYVFHLGLIEAISYWKAACPPEFVVQAGELSPDQIRFWEDLFLHGLGEFFYRNNIDFTQPDFFRMDCQPTTDASRSGATENTVAGQDEPLDSSTDLVLVGGGKDSAVSMAVMKQYTRKVQTMVVNPTEAAMANLLTAGLARPIIVERLIDERLLQLNKQGYLNGHTPFSALLAFLGITVASLYANENIVVSNERSADEGNVMFHGMEVNHQYSKSYRFEELFREYARAYLPGSAQYFSLLRPLNEMQISQLFAGFPAFFPTFRSCNVGSKTNTWCGRCPKCTFTYLMLSPFVSTDQMQKIFGRDYFDDPNILVLIRELTGLTPVKPFECVGTRRESQLAVLLSVEKYKRENEEVPEGLLRIKSDLSLSSGDELQLKNDVLTTWGDTYNLPAEHLALLKNAWANR